MCAVKRHNASVPFGANEGIFNNGKGRPAIATEETEGNHTKAVSYKSRIWTLLIDILSIAKGWPKLVLVILDHSICDSRKPCLAAVAHEFYYPSQTTLSFSLPMMGVTKKVADAGSVGGWTSNAK
jgi:hypothetical protein